MNTAETIPDEVHLLHDVRDVPLSDLVAASTVSGLDDALDHVLRHLSEHENLAAFGNAP